MDPIGLQVYALACLEYRRRGLEPPQTNASIKTVNDQLLAWAHERAPEQPVEPSPPSDTDARLNEAVTGFQGRRLAAALGATIYSDDHDLGPEIDAEQQRRRS